MTSANSERERGSLWLIIVNRRFLRTDLSVWGYFNLLYFHRSSFARLGWCYLKNLLKCCEAREGLSKAGEWGMIQHGFSDLVYETVQRMSFCSWGYSSWLTWHGIHDAIQPGRTGRRRRWFGTRAIVAPPSPQVAACGEAVARALLRLVCVSDLQMCDILGS